MKPILEIQGISKKFRIRHEFLEPYLSFRDAITNVFKRKKNTEEFWALKDITFDVLQGESIGIIGKNGAGKSTLLKILSKITPPTSGRIISRGRIASLLEVGTGFHPELSGRENVFLNGSILGMRRNEINTKFDEIVDFSGVERFLDTPLKHYSSGMQLRLAFAVAAFLEPEILVIDEVLSVGDAEFQKKCIGKMEDISKKEGKTVIFVSHDLASVKRLCDKTILLSSGMIIQSGETEDVISYYQSEIIKRQTDRVVKGNGLIKVNDIFLRNFKNEAIVNFNTFDHVRIEVKCESKQEIESVSFAIGFNNLNHVRITSLWTGFYGQRYHIHRGEFTIVFDIPKINLIPGEYEMITYIDSKGILVEGIENFKTIIVGYTDKFESAEEPKPMHGCYLEEFSTSIIKN